MGPHLFDFEELLFLLVILPASIAMRPCCVIACHLPPSCLKSLESKQEISLLCEIRRRWSTNESLLKETPKLWECGKGSKFSCFFLFSPTSCVWSILKSAVRWKEAHLIHPGSRKHPDALRSIKLCLGCCCDVYLGQKCHSRSHRYALF